MQATTTRPKIIVAADGAGVVSHVGSRLRACEDLARQREVHLDRTALEAFGSEPRRPSLWVVR